MTLFIAWGQKIRPKGEPQPPGNSLPLVDEAYALGYDGVELDVQLSRDGVLVLMHNGTVDETTHASGHVAEMTLAELRAIRLRDPFDGPACHIATLEEALVLNGTRGPVMVDMRQTGRPHLDALHSAVGNAGFAPARLLLLAYGPEQGVRLKTRFPAATVMLKAPAGLKPPALGLDFVAQGRGLDAVICSIANDLPAVEAFQAECQAQGLKLGTYIHGGRKDTLTRQVELGVFSVTTYTNRSFTAVREAMAARAAA